MNKNKFDFSNKTAVITGGAQGFGLDIAKRFLDSGAKVIIWDIDSKLLDKVILVESPKNLKVARIMFRDRIKEEEVFRRMSKQWSDNQKRTIADYVIKNDEKSQKRTYTRNVAKSLHLNRK